MNAIVKVAFSFAFCFCLVGGTLMFSGVSSYKTAQEMETHFEPTTFENFVAGDVTNRYLFEISKFRAGEKYYAIEDRRNDILRVAYVPLYAEDQPQDDGAGVGAVALVSRVAEKDLLTSLDIPKLQVRVTDNIPAYAYDLGEAYPAIDWSKVKVVYVDASIPTTISAMIYLGIGIGLVIFGLVAAGFGCALKWRTMKATGTKLSYNEKVQESEQYSAAPNREVTSSKSKTILGKVAEFSLFAFPFLILCNVAIVALLRMELVNEQVGYGILFFTGPLFLILSVGGLALRFFVPPIFKIQRVELEEVPLNAQRKMVPEIEFFMQSGFEMLGFAKTHFMSDKWNSFLIAPDRQSVVEITVEGGKVSCAIVGVAEHGLMFVIARNESEQVIDGTQMGVPLAAKMSKKFSNNELITIFEEFERAAKAEGSRLLPISPKDVFHVMHYDSILAGWWAYKSSLRFSKPDALPTIEEVVKTVGGIEEFGFQRCSDFDNAFAAPTASNVTNDSEPQSQLATARLLNSVR